MVGAVDGYHDTIYDTAQESLNRRRSVTTSVSTTTETQSVAPTPTRCHSQHPPLLHHQRRPSPSPTPPPSNPSPPPSSPV